MNAIKRVGIIVIVFLALFLLSESFIVESISDRAILIGLGIDYEDNQYLVTGEMLTGGNTESGQAGFSKLVEGRGTTVSQAIQNLYQLTGRQPSLGLCSVIVIGKSLYTQKPLNELLSYFTFSDAFRDGSMLVCAEDSAQKIMSTASPLNQSPSFALSEIIQKSGKSVTVPKMSLQKFVNSQLTLSQSGFLNVVAYVDSAISNDLDDQSQDNITQGNFLVKTSALFKEFKFVDVLDEKENQGYCLFKEKDVYQGFLVEEGNTQIPLIYPKLSGLSVVNKKIDAEIKLEEGIPKLDIKIELKLKRSYTDNNEKISILMPKDNNRITPDMFKSVEKQSVEMILSAVEKSRKSSCDYCGLSNDLYKKYGYSWSNLANENPQYLLENLVVSVEVSCHQ